MAPLEEIPVDLIRQVQILLRKDVNLSSYDPHDPSLPNLPSTDQIIAEFDPSPPHLRCTDCRGRLPRGLQSIMCVYCGREQKREIAPEPILFKNTTGFRWLLETLDLDGSEALGPSTGVNELNRGRNALKDEGSLSDLLDLEIKWTSESEKLGAGVSSEASIRSKSPLNLAGVDLDNIFTEAKRDTVIKASEEQLAATKEIRSKESNALQGHENLSLFENVHPSKTVVRPAEDKNNAAFSGWEAEFQPANSESVHEGSKEFDASVGSTVDLSSHMDVVFGSGKDINSAHDDTTPASRTNDWIQDDLQDDLWNNLNSKVPAQVGQVESTIQAKDGQNLTGTSSTKDDWFQDDQWQNSSAKSTDNKIAFGKNDNLFDAWNDFPSSSTSQDPLRSSWKQNGSPLTPSVEQTSEPNFLSSTSNVQEMEFGNFSQQDLFSGAFSNQNDSSTVTNMLPKDSDSDRKADRTAEDGGSLEQAVKDEDILDATTSSNADDVEMLMSQMHDLSFMLESKLSVPQS